MGLRAKVNAVIHKGEHPIRMLSGVLDDTSVADKSCSLLPCATEHVPIHLVPSQGEFYSVVHGLASTTKKLPNHGHDKPIQLKMVYTTQIPCTDIVVHETMSGHNICRPRSIR